MEALDSTKKQLIIFLSAPDLPPCFGVSKVQRVCGIGYNWAARVLELGLTTGQIVQGDHPASYKIPSATLKPPGEIPQSDRIYMSEIHSICKNIAEQSEDLLVEMLKENWPDNIMLLGGVLDGAAQIQIQLLITKNTNDFLDEQ